VTCQAFEATQKSFEETSRWHLAKAL